MSLKNNKEKKINKIKKIAIGAGAAILAVVVIGVAIKVASGGKTVAGYKKPEKAIESFTKDIAAGDYESALKSFDSEERAQSIDLEKYVKRMQVFMPSNMPPVKEYSGIAKAEFEGVAATQTKYFAYSLIGGGADNAANNENVKNIAVDEENTPEKIVKVFDPKKLQKLEVVRCDDADKVTQDSDLYKSNMEELCAIYGCKNIREYVALFKVGKNYYQGFFTLAEYDKGWKIQSLTAPLQENSSEGFAVSTTEKEYKELLKSKE